MRTPDDATIAAFLDLAIGFGHKRLRASH